MISHYPVGGNDANTGPRYQVEAEMTGFDIVGVTRVGTNTMWPSPRVRKQLSTGAFPASCEDQARALLPLCEGYETVVLRGQSTGAFPTMGIARTGIIPLTHLLIEDGINTRRSSRGGMRGALAARWDWLRYTAVERRTMARPPVPSWKLPSQLPGSWRTVAMFFVEQYHWAPLWRSTYTRDVLLELVERRPDVPVLIKMLGHTATSTEREANDLKRDIDAGVARSPVKSGRAPVIVDIDSDAWHGFLVYPEYGAKNLSQVHGMRSATPDGPGLR